VVGVETTGQMQPLHSASQLAHYLVELMELDTEKQAVITYVRFILTILLVVQTVQYQIIA
jgi:hypothetical protein